MLLSVYGDFGRFLFGAYKKLHNLLRVIETNTS